MLKKYLLAGTAILGLTMSGSAAPGLTPPPAVSRPSVTQSPPHRPAGPITSIAPRPAQQVPNQRLDLRPNLPPLDRPIPQTNELKFPVQPAPQAPSRFEGGGFVVPTPSGGAQGAGVLRDNKHDRTYELYPSVEPHGSSVKGQVTLPLPETKK